MQLLSVNVSLPKNVPYQGEILTTGIYKEPRAGRVTLHRTHLEGDGQADLVAHGGADKAVYAYTVENYTYWQAELGVAAFPYGQFGENFTVTDMPEDAVCIGDVYQVGAVRLEVSQPRLPCFKLTHKMGIHAFEKQFLESLRVGFYLRVVQGGQVGAGDAIQRLQVGAEQMTIQEITHAVMFDKTNRAQVERALSIPALSSAWREWLQKRLTD